MEDSIEDILVWVTVVVVVVVVMVVGGEIVVVEVVDEDYLMEVEVVEKS